MAETFTRTDPQTGVTIEVPNQYLGNEELINRLMDAAIRDYVQSRPPVDTTQRDPTITREDVGMDPLQDPRDVIPNMAAEGRNIADQMYSDIAPAANSFGHGMLDTITLGAGDEIAAGVESLFGRPFDEAYAGATSRQNAAQEQFPLIYGGGQLGGILATAPFAAGVGPFNAATGVGRAGNAAVVGGGLGVPYGYFSGEGDWDDPSRLWGAGIGGGAGAIGGALGQTVLDVGSIAARAATAGARRLIPGVSRSAPAAEVTAAQRVAEGLRRDAESMPPLMNQDENFYANPISSQAERIGQAEQAGIPLMMADLGGENTRALLRSASNTSPAARGEIAQMTQDRFETQAERMADQFSDILGFAGDTEGAMLGLQAAARNANQSAYNRAYQSENAQFIWDADLEALTVSPTFQQAMRQVNRTAGDEAAIAGQPRITDPFVPTAEGGVRLNPATEAGPTLQYWDHVSRNLSDIISSAQRQGNNELARHATLLRNRLLERLDQAVPEFEAARQGAASFFGAQDALTAGSNALNMRVSNATIQRGFDAMSDAEQALFRQGYANEMLTRLRSTDFNRNAVKQTFLNNQQARERLGIVFGPEQAARLENVIRLEDIFNATRAALGNSTTAQQLADLMLAGGVAGVVQGAQGFESLDPAAIFAGLITLGARRGYARFDANVATEVGSLLAAGTRESVERAADILARTPGGNTALRVVDETVGRFSSIGAFEYVADGVVPDSAQPQNYGPNASEIPLLN